MTTLDMRTQPCPIPVIQAKKALAAGGGVMVLVDNIIAVQNLRKMANGLGYDFAEERRSEDEFAVTIRPSADAVANADTQSAAQTDAPAHTQMQMPERAQLSTQSESPFSNMPMPAASSVSLESVPSVVLITSDQMGRGSEELGRILIKGFIFSLTQLPVLPEAVLFLNAGVKLAIRGSNTLDDLKALEESGVAVCACGTCLNYYGLLDELGVGEVVNMMQIAERITGACKTVVI